MSLVKRNQGGKDRRREIGKTQTKKENASNHAYISPGQRASVQVIMGRMLTVAFLLVSTDRVSGQIHVRGSMFEPGYPQKHYNQETHGLVSQRL
jgi:hypothetical protein